MQKSTSTVGSAAPPRAGEPALRLEGVRKSFGAVQALRGVDLDVWPGEVVGLVGDNGAGKSTLIKAIAGVHTADAGQFYLDGKRVSIHSPQDATALGIETVYQDLALCDNLDVVANLYLGHELTHGPLPRPVRQMDEVAMERRTLDVLHDLDVKIPSVRVPVAALSGGQRQSIAVAKTLLREAKVVQLDEPTAALGVAQTRQVLNLIRRLRDLGVAVVVISHNLADVFEVADRAVVLRLGRRVASFDLHDPTTTPEMVIGAITGAIRGADAEDATAEADDAELAAEGVEAGGALVIGSGATTGTAATSDAPADQPRSVEPGGADDNLK